MTIDDDSTLRRIARGDQSAVEDCIDRHGGLVWSIARRLVDDQAEAEDAVQEVFIELWKFADRFDPAVSSESTFVAMIARRRLIDRRRKSRRAPDLSSLPEGLASTEIDLSALIDRSDEADRAARAIEELRPEHRDVLILSIRDGLTHDAIAHRLGLPVGTVKTHARRGLIRLRELLEAPQAAPRAGGDR